MSEDKAAEYAKVNPLGGPARVFEAMAERIRSGEAYEEVLADYGLQEIPVTTTKTLRDEWAMAIFAALMRWDFHNDSDEGLGEALKDAYIRADEAMKARNK